MSTRRKTPPDIEADVLIQSGRKCCLCFSIDNDYMIKQGQIAHIDKNPANYDPDNLAFLCLNHHDSYDSKTSQSKGITLIEVKKYRDILYSKVVNDREKVGEIKTLLDSAAESPVEPPKITKDDSLPPAQAPIIQNRKPSADEKKAMRLASAGYSEETKKQLRSLFYTTTDPIAQVQCIRGLSKYFDFIHDSVTELLTLIDQGIRITQELNFPDAEAILLANKGKIISQDFLLKDLDGYYRVQMSNRTGIPMISDEERQRIVMHTKDLQESYKSLFKDAIQKAYGTGNPEVVAAVLLEIGSSAGQRALQFQTIKMYERAENEKALAKATLLEAKNIYLAKSQNELHAGYALHQLANQIRFLGEIEEAKAICKKVILIAKKYKDKALQTQAKKMFDRIESGRIPDYMHGETD
jgi:hypothetical protein